MDRCLSESNLCSTFLALVFQFCLFGNGHNDRAAHLLHPSHLSMVLCALPRVKGVIPSVLGTPLEIALGVTPSLVVTSLDLVVLEQTTQI